MIDEKVIVLDFGGQFNQLIARRVRDLGVYCEVLPYDTAPETYRCGSLRAVILTGGPSSVYGKEALFLPDGVLDLGVPVLGICYGAQLIVQMLGGDVRRGETGEYGYAQMLADECPLFQDIEPRSVVWMNHTDRISALPEGFTALAKTDLCPTAAYGNDALRLYGVQFHPEVQHTQHGREILKNFLRNICGCRGDWKAADMERMQIEAIRAAVGPSKVVSGLSGGVDSSVASVLTHRAVGDQLTCIFVDHGLLRKNEAQEVMRVYGEQLGLNIIHVDASERFLKKLEGVSDPERKRKIIGEEFIRVFEEESDKIGAEYLVQGTIYPDVIESGKGPAAVIKSHHNVGGLPEDVRFKGLIEPLRMLFKDEVRALGEQMGIPHDLVWRQPFPGPGLAIRVIGEITPDKLAILREADAIYREEIFKAGYAEKIWQYFAVYTGVRSVGVMGDGRTYEQCIALRAVTSSDAMTVECADLPIPMLSRIANRIINQVRGVNRVVYDITSKPPGTIEWE